MDMDIAVAVFAIIPASGGRSFFVKFFIGVQLWLLDLLLNRCYFPGFQEEEEE